MFKLGRPSANGSYWVTATTDRHEKKRLKRELNALRSTCERENARAAAEARQANEAREKNLRARRVESGSRFNVRCKHGIPHEAITAEGLMRVLAQYLDFPGFAAAPAAAAPVSAALAAPQEYAANGGSMVSQSPTMPNPTNGAAPASGLAALKTGLTPNEVEALLGAAQTAAEVQEGAMSVMKRTCAVDGMKVTTSFVSGVLIDFSITPQ